MNDSIDKLPARKTSHYQSSNILTMKLLQKYSRSHLPCKFLYCIMWVPKDNSLCSMKASLLCICCHSLVSWCKSIKKIPKPHPKFCGSLVGFCLLTSSKTAWNKILFYILLLQNLFCYILNTYHTKYIKKVKMHILADANICTAYSNYREVEINH